MIIEQQIPTFVAFVKDAGLQWLISVATLFVVAVIVGLVVTVVGEGFTGATKRLWNGISRGFGDLLFLSCRRTLAIATLVVKESIRRRIVAIGIVFMLLLMFAGWYLDPNSEDPAKLYLSFVLSASSYLTMLMVLFLSAFSLPTDFKNKTLYTVATKPVRSSELVLGRILGISFVGSIMLLLMAICSYYFVTFGLKHTHLLTQREDLTELSVPADAAENPQRVVATGDTQIASGHQHAVQVLADGSVRVERVGGHSHEVRVEKIDGERTKYTVLEDVGTLQARVPVYGKLMFRAASGLDATAGINVGDEWMYRSYIGGDAKGGTNEEAAMFTFYGITPWLFPVEDFPKGLPIEMTLGVFRTHKGKIEQRVSGSLSVRNPETGLRVEVLTFSTQEFISRSLAIPWTFSGTPQITQRRSHSAETGNMIVLPDDMYAVAERNRVAAKTEFDLMRDFVTKEGMLEVWLQCIDSGQYVGVAQADLYLRGRDASVPLNFAKGFFGIWQQMMFLVVFGVLFSTFLSGPVAMLATLGVMIAGFSKAFLVEIGLNKVLGGGPFESFVRMVTQQNLVVDLPESFATSFIKACDVVFGSFLTLVGRAIPPLSDYTIYYQSLSNGFDISGNLILIHFVMTISYLIPLFVVSYLLLANREVAK
ncbi:MAG: ABC transporter permease [Thermoguttaceae bacterium]